MTVAAANVLISTESMNREDWLKWRNKGIGGSDASIICGINKYKSPVELWMEKTGQIEPKEAGEAAYWGTIMEPIIREEFTRRTGLEVGIEKSILQHPVHSFMFANLDGIAIDNDQKKGFIFEAKTASAYNSHEWDLDIPEGYMLQVQHYMAVTGLTGAFVAVLIGGNEFKYYFVERDDDLISILIKLERQFWNCVINNKPPQIDGSKASTELLNWLYPAGKEKEKVIQLPNEAIDLITQYEQYQTAESEASLKKDEASNKLKELLGDNLKAAVSGRLVYWSNVTTERFDSKAFKAEQPELYSQYLAKSTFRRFGIR